MYFGLVVNKKGTLTIIFLIIMDHKSKIIKIMIVKVPFLLLRIQSSLERYDVISYSIKI